MRKIDKIEQKLGDLNLLNYQQNHISENDINGVNDEMRWLINRVRRLEEALRIGPIEDLADCWLADVESYYRDNAHKVLKEDKDDRQKD